MIGSVLIRKRQLARKSNVEEKDEGAHAKESVDDGGNTGEVDDGEVDDSGQPVVRRIFAEIDRGRDPDWDRGQQRDDNECNGTQQCGEDAPPRSYRQPGPRSKMPS